VAGQVLKMRQFKDLKNVPMRQQDQVRGQPTWASYWIHTKKPGSKTARLTL